MKRTLQSILVITLLTIGFTANSQTRYLDDMFSAVTVTSDVTYATNVSILPMLQGLPPAAAPINCDIYEPTGDTETDRPVIILAHTGSFLPPVINGQATGSKTDLSIVEQCTRWAKKGYVAVAMSYRLGWNPTSTDQNTRTSTLIQAAYRSIQDGRSLIRFMRQEEANGDPYGIDGSKIVFGGQGTGGYISLGIATLDTTAELFLTKFLDLSDPSNPIPYVYPPVFGNIWGTDMGYMPLYDSLGNVIGQAPFALPNNIGYSSDISMAFNIGGCLADSSWLEDGDAPMVSFHCAKDPAGPYANGDVIVPTTGDFVIEAQGSYIVQKHQDMYGNNAPFASTSFTDPITAQSVINNTTYSTINNYPVGNNYEGLYTFITPPPSTTPNAYGQYEVEQSAPWDWWDNAAYGVMAQAVNGVPGVTSPAFFEANALLSSPNMGPTSGNLYLDTIQNYLNPRIFATLGFVAGCIDPTACNYDASANVDDGSCILPDGCTDPNACNYDASAICDDGSCLTDFGCIDTTACNYDASATCDDGSCIFGSTGCTDPAACNYDASAACDDGSCLTDYGCMNSAATNYDPMATCPDTCIFPVVTFGCTDSTAYNYNPTATVDDSSCCFIAGCTDPLAFNYDITACYDDGSCIPVTLGCTYTIACNYDASANTDDGSCDFPDGCGDSLYVEYDPSVTCSDPDACITLISTGINQAINSSTEIYPNPAKNSLNVVSNSIINTIAIYNLHSQEVLNTSVDANQTKIDVSTLRKGVYIIDIRSNDTSIKRKLILE